MIMEHEDKPPRNSEQEGLSELEAERQCIHEEIQAEVQQLPDDALGRERREFLTREPAFYAYGGTSYETRRQMPGFYEVKPDKNMQVLQDDYGLRVNQPAFGVGRGWNRKYIIYRELQDRGHRQYVLTYLFDPGEESWRLYGQNGALLLRNIQRDSEIREWFTLKPEQMTEVRMKEYIERLTRADRTVESESKPELEALLRDSGQRGEVEVVGTQDVPRPDIDQMTASLAATTESTRRDSTWLINGGDLHGRELGAQLVWDPGK